MKMCVPARLKSCESAFMNLNNKNLIIVQYASSTCRRQYIVWTGISLLKKLDIDSKSFRIGVSINLCASLSMKTIWRKFFAINVYFFQQTYSCPYDSIKRTCCWTQLYRKVCQVRHFTTTAKVTIASMKRLVTVVYFLSVSTSGCYYMLKKF